MTHHQTEPALYPNSLRTARKISPAFAALFCSPLSQPQLLRCASPSPPPPGRTRPGSLRTSPSPAPPRVRNPDSLHCPRIRATCIGVMTSNQGATMPIPKKVAERLIHVLKSMMPIIEQQRSRDVSEADTSTLVKDLLSTVNRSRPASSNSMLYPMRSL